MTSSPNKLGATGATIKLTGVCCCPSATVSRGINHLPWGPR